MSEVEFDRLLDAVRTEIAPFRTPTFRTCRSPSMRRRWPQTTTSLPGRSWPFPKAGARPADLACLSNSLKQDRKPLIGIKKV